MRSLPISPLLPKIQQSLFCYHNLVLQAEPGAGKSTAVPLALLNAPWLMGQKIIMLEPRRLAVKSIAHYLAKQLGEKVGNRIGYQIRNEKISSSETILEIVTEGILIRRLQQDPELSGVALIIFDEFHERSLHADLSLTFCLDIQSALRDDLKLLVMSATIDTQAVSAFMELNNKPAPIICSQGKSFPVSVHYLSKPLKSFRPVDWLPILKNTLLEALQTTKGDLLVFLPGQGEIKRTQRLLEEILPKNFVILPLYGSLKPEQQQTAIELDKQGRRKIILATNIAETSLTIEGITVVVDSGFSRKALYDVSSGLTTLTSQKISQASAKQRQGRAGRLEPGYCYRLWTQSQHQQLLKYDLEEIKHTDLTGLCLELALWGVNFIEAMRWLTPPPNAHYLAGKKLLSLLGLLNNSGRLTPLGQSTTILGASPRLAKMLLFSHKLPQTKLITKDLTSLACDVAAVLSERDVLQCRGDTDIIKRLLALQAYRLDKNQAQCSYPIQASAMKQALKNSQYWQNKLQVKPVQAGLLFLQNNVGRLVALAYPDRVAQKRKINSNKDQVGYLMTNGRGANLCGYDAMQNNTWLAIANVDGLRQGGYIQLAAAISLKDIETLFVEEITTLAQYQFKQDKKEIFGSKQTKLKSLVLSESTLIKPHKKAFQSCLLEAVKNDLSLLSWPKNHQNWLHRVRWLHSFNNDFTNLSESWLKNNLDMWLSPFIHDITSIKMLQKLNMKDILLSQIPYEKQQQLKQQAPVFYTTPSQQNIPIDYQGTIPKVSVILQEMFGELNSPKLAWGKVQLTFELLSPARRPIQVTADIANFWHNSYFEVRKEMKGRYPKHRWPENPLEEKAGKSFKNRT